jgi:Ca2+-binding RTX toxin-like protein
MVAPVDAIGEETRLGSGTFPQLIHLNDGNIVAVWLDGSAGIYFQVLNADLSPLTDPTPLGRGGYFEVTALADGGFAIINSGSYATAFTFTADGQAVGSPLVLGGMPYQTSSIDIAALPDGGYVASWYGFSGLEMAFVDASGAIANSYDFGQIDAIEPTIEVLANGNVMVFFSREDTETPPVPYADGYEVVGQVFTSEGVPVTDTFLVNQTQVGSHGFSDTALLSNGNVAVTWVVFGTGGGIFVRIFDPNGDPVTDAIRVSNLEDNWQANADVVATDTGFLVTWSDSAPDNTDDLYSGIRGQLFGNGGYAVGEEFQVNAQFGGDEVTPDVVVISSTEALAVYSASGNAEPGGILVRSIALPAFGTPAADSWTGTDADETYLGLGGDDDIFGAGGDDVLSGDAGNDRIEGQLGNDELLGGDGDDRLIGGGGWDSLFGGEGFDELSGGNGNDLLDGGAGTNELDGGFGNDTASYVDAPFAVNVQLSSGYAQVGDSTDQWSFDTLIGIENIDGSQFDDTIFGDAGTNILRGFAGNDFIYGFGSAAGENDVLAGGDGNDYLLAYRGTAIMYGGSGDDFMRGDSGVDTYFGGAGFDRVSFFFRNATQGVIADLRTGTISNDGFGNVETMEGVEALGGVTQFADELYGDDNDNSLFGGYGGDLLYGFGGDDFFGLYGAAKVVDGGSGIDTVGFSDYTFGADLNGDGIADDIYAYEGVVVDLSAGQIIADGMGGAGSIANVENVIGTYFPDVIVGDDAENLIYGEGGSDVMSGGLGDDTIYGGIGWDTLRGGGSSDKLYGENGNDRIFGDNGDDLLSGGDGNDVLLGGAGQDALDGWRGNDWMDGGNGNDTLWGGAGQDTLTGGWGTDLLIGGGGSDTFLFRDGHASRWIGNADTISDFVSGQDTIDLSAMDANSATAGDDAFAFIGSSAFSGTAGELRAFSTGGNTFLAGDTDGDGAADFFIKLQGDFALTGADFIL